MPEPGDDVGRGRNAAGAGLLGLGVVAAWEMASVARVVRRGDAGGRADHAYRVGEGLGEPLHLLLLGDSAVDGYGLTADEALPRQLATRVAAATGRRVVVRCLAVSGATTSDVARFQVPLLRAADQIDAIVIGVGVNEVLKRTPAAAVDEATRQLIAGVQRAAPAAAVAFVVCHDLSTAPGFGPVLRRVVGARCRAVARRQTRVLRQHGVRVVQGDTPGAPQMYGRDGLHPGPLAIVAIADAVTATLVARSAVLSDA
jgi:lysophospholipase L1-like esterase